MSTENGITCFSSKDKLFYNWTKGARAYVCPTSMLLPVLLLKDKGFIFGSIDGAIEFPKDIKFPHYQFSKIILSDFRLSYQPVFSGEENSPLTEDIDDIKVLKLSHNQKYFLTKKYRPSTTTFHPMCFTAGNWKAFILPGVPREQKT